MWHEEAEEPEDNVLALTLSFLTAARSNQAVCGNSKNGKCSKAFE